MRDRQLGALRRLEQLIQEAVVTVPRALIAETINIDCRAAGRGADRRLAELAVVKGLEPDGDYAISLQGRIRMIRLAFRRLAITSTASFDRHLHDVVSGLCRRHRYALGATAQSDPAIG